MTNSKSMDDLEQYIIKYGFTESFKYIKENINVINLNYEDYIILFDLVDDYKQAKWVLNVMSKKLGAEPPRNVLVRLLWKPVNSEKQLSELRNFYSRNFSKKVFEERLNNPVLIYYEHELKEKRFKSLREKYNKIEESIKLEHTIKKREVTHSTYARSPQVKKMALERANYLCELDSNHITFTSKTTNRNYVEVHHLVPMDFQENFQYSLDVVANVVCLCPNCHKLLHHGKFEEYKPQLSKLFHSREQELGKYGINVNLDELYSYYIKGFKDDGGLIDE